MKILRIPLLIVLTVAAGRTFSANALTVTETVLHSFTATPDGFNPVAGVVQGSDSNFYGTTRGGGTFNSGTVFRVNSDGTYTNLYSFGGSPDGSTPLDGLVQGSDSNFYGTTFGGGTGTHDAPSGGAGTVFRISPSGTYTSLYSFASYQDDAALPYGGLVQGTNGNFYGTTGAGGPNLRGTVFEITPDGVETILYSFAGPPNDGANPQAGLVLASDGDFYGTTYFGGSSTNCGEPGCGTVFRISPDGVYSNLYSLGGHPSDGTGPRAALIEGIDGNFYGTTWIGGSSGHCAFGCGTVFQITPGGIETNLHSFDETDGANLAGALVQGSNSNFYGTTFGGGPGYGNVFRISPSGVFSNIYSIPYVVGLGAADGISPEAGLVLGSDGDFYGTTAGGGTSANCGAGGCGTVFKLAITSGGVGGGGGGGGCTYTLTPTTITVTAKGGKKSVGIKAVGTGCAWTAASNNSFIMITSGSSGTGNGKVSFNVAGNTNTTAQIGTLTIASESVTVTQAPGGCTFKLSPKNGKHLAKGGAKTVRVTPNLNDCEWTAVSNSGFITITTGSTNILGKGTVSYTVATNATSMILTGSMTIAGQPYTVIQAGVK